MADSGFVALEKVRVFLIIVVGAADPERNAITEERAS